MYSSFFSRIYIVDLWLVLVYHIYKYIPIQNSLILERKTIEIPQIPNFMKHELILFSISFDRIEVREGE